MVIQAAEQDWERVSEAIVRRRMELNITIVQAAKRVKMSPATWGEVENHEKTRYRADTLRKIALALEWPTDHLLNVLRSSPPDTEQRIAILEEAQAATSLEISQLGGNLTQLARQVEQLVQRLDRLYPPPGRGGR